MSEARERGHTGIGINALPRKGVSAKKHFVLSFIESGPREILLCL
jgi:hypothetical protein